MKVSVRCCVTSLPPMWSGICTSSGCSILTRRRLPRANLFGSPYLKRLRPPPSASHRTCWRASFTAMRWMQPHWLRRREAFLHARKRSWSKRSSRCLRSSKNQGNKASVFRGWLPLPSKACQSISPRSPTSSWKPLAKMAVRIAVSTHLSQPFRCQCQLPCQCRGRAAFLCPQWWSTGSRSTTTKPCFF